MKPEPLTPQVLLGCMFRSSVDLWRLGMRDKRVASTLVRCWAGYQRLVPDPRYDDNYTQLDALVRAEKALVFGAIEATFKASSWTARCQHLGKLLDDVDDDSHWESLQTFEELDTAGLVAWARAALRFPGGRAAEEAEELAKAMDRLLVEADLFVCCASELEAVLAAVRIAPDAGLMGTLLPHRIVGAEAAFVRGLSRVV